MTPGKYGKLWAGIAGLAITVATTKYGNTTWLPYVVAAASAAGIYGVPNAPSILKSNTVLSESEIAKFKADFLAAQNTGHPTAVPPFAPLPEPVVARPVVVPVGPPADLSIGPTSGPPITMPPAAPK